MRRSTRSESQPIGYWQISAPTKKAEMKREISSTLKPAEAANTEDMPNCTENTPPSISIPKHPSGEMRNSLGMPSGLVVSKAGAGLTVSRIGAKASETRIEGTTNMAKSPGAPGLPSVTAHCAVTMAAI